MKPDWIFLRGLSREAEHWGTFPQQFQDALGCTVHLLDAPGVGEYHHMKSPVSLDEMADFMLGQMQERSLEHVHVFAYSLGAMISYIMLQKQPQRFGNVVWLNTSFANLSPIYKRMQISRFKDLCVLASRYSNVWKRESIVYRITTRMHGDPSIIAKWVEIQKKHPVTLATIIRQLWAAKSSSIQEKPDHPLLLLGSQGDQLVSPSCTEELSRYLNQPAIMHARAGHDVTLDAPEWVIDQVSSFVSSVTS